MIKVIQNLWTRAIKNQKSSVSTTAPVVAERTNGAQMPISLAKPGAKA